MKKNKPSYKFLYRNKFLSLCQTNHNFIFAQRRNINSTASLCYKNVNNSYYFLLRYQPLPVSLTIPNKKWNDLFPCPITGSLEKQQKPLDNAIQEIFEEANIVVNKNNLVAHNFTISTTQMNEMVFNFVFDVTDCQIINKISGDGSIFEKCSRNKWVTIKQLKKIISNRSKYYFLSSLLNCFYLFELKNGKIEK